jgi:tRNA-modifying protein YgfZ
MLADVSRAGNANGQVDALLEGRASVDLTHHRKVHVTGEDARGWLNDLVTAGVEALRPGEARRTLLLSPTGRIRADLHAYGMPDGLLLVQDPSQPAAVDALLERYVLSSDVRLTDRTTELCLFALPGPGHPMGIEELPTWRPSCLGEGADVLLPVDRRDQASERLLAAGRVPAGEEAVEAWRVLTGEARFPIDLDEDSLPAEAGLDARTVDTTKGCFLGQESVARVRNLGHPPRVVRPFRAEGHVAPGDALMLDGREVGRVTSAVPIAEGTALLARVRWEARRAELRTPTGLVLRRPVAPAAP